MLSTKLKTYEATHPSCNTYSICSAKLSLYLSVLTRDAPIIGRLSAVLPIIGIGRLLRRYQLIIVYTLVVFDGVKTSRMLSCQAVTIGRDARGWRHWRGEGCAARVVTGQWSTTPCNPSPRHPSRHPARVHRQCWIIQCELLAFVLFLELFVLIGNWPIIGRPIIGQCVIGASLGKITQRNTWHWHVPLENYFASSLCKLKRIRPNKSCTELHVIHAETLTTVGQRLQIIMIMIMTSGWGLQQRPTSQITKNTVH